MARIFGPPTDQRGSILLVSLVMVFVMTLLGLAMFDLAALENRLGLTSQTDARAFEVAQAGLERGLLELRNGILNDPVDLASFADGTPACTPSPCATTTYKNLSLSNTAMPGGGTYAIELMLITVTDANTLYGITCLADTGTPTVCANLAFLRSSGTLTDTGTGAAPTGFTRSRTLQAMARASSSSAAAVGMTGGAPSGQSLQGNVKIAGSIHILGDPGTAALSFGGGAGQRNNWADLDSTSLDRITPLQLVCPYGNPSCAASAKVESLGAVLKVAKPITTPAVTLSGTAELGQASDSGSYGSPSRKGKGSLDEVLVADGCQQSNCSDSFTGASSIYVDGGIKSKPYPDNPAPPYPLLTDPITIAGVSYNHFACPNPAGSCNPANAYINTHAANFTTDATIANSLGSASGLTDNTASFFSTVKAFTNKNGATRYGQICWDSVTETLTFATSSSSLLASCIDPLNPLAPGAPPSEPLLVYLDGGFKIERQGGPTPMSYKGTAIIVTTGGAGATAPVKIEETWQSFCTIAPCTSARFPENLMMAVLSFANMEIGKDNSNIDRIFGYFFTAGDFISQKQTNIVGSVTGWRLCFGGGCGYSGGNVPSFFQVPVDPRGLPEELLPLGGKRWTASFIRRFWMECRPGTLPTTPTGICGY